MSEWHMVIETVGGSKHCLVFNDEARMFRAMETMQTAMSEGNGVHIGDTRGVSILVDMKNVVSVIAAPATERT